MLSGNADRLCGLDPATLFAPVATQKIIGLAVSGGADSLALMLLYAGWTDPGKPRAIVYTLDHGLRPEARGEAEMVVRVAQGLGLEVRLLAWPGRKPETGKQQAARRARYRLIGAAMQADGAKILLTAHHRRDQAETVLMRLAHGSGVTGLGGMHALAEVEGVKAFRPLLETGPDVLSTIVARAGLDPARDPSNADPAYERTRWRHALPQLAGLGLTEERLALAARRFRRIDALAEKLTDDFLAAHGWLHPLGVVFLARGALLAADPEIAVRALSRALACASGARNYGLGKIEALHERLGASDFLAATLAGARIVARGGDILVHREAGRIAEGQTKLAAGESMLWDGRFTITAQTGSLKISAGSDLKRAEYEAFADQPLAVPVAALRAAPVVRERPGAILAIGGVLAGKGVDIVQTALTAQR